MKLTDLFPLILLFTLSHATITPGNPMNTPCDKRNITRYCAGTNYTESLTSTYVCGDSRLGPTHLPTRHDDPSVAPVIVAALLWYDRFGSLCPGDYLDKWWDKEEKWWAYPPQYGFAVDRVPIEGTTLPVDELLDRFGSEGGEYLSPAGTPYGWRALPPSNLAPYDSSHPYNYHVYRVIKPLPVLSGPIAPWFGQEGTGVQHKLYDKVWWLVKNGYLRQENATVLDNMVLGT